MHTITYKMREGRFPLVVSSHLCWFSFSLVAILPIVDFYGFILVVFPTCQVKVRDFSH